MAFSFRLEQCLNFSFDDESIQEGEQGFLFLGGEFLHLLEPADQFLVQSGILFDILSRAVHRIVDGSIQCPGQPGHCFGIGFSLTALISGHLGKMDFNPLGQAGLSEVVPLPR